MPATLDYSYDDGPEHLTDQQAVDRYTKVRSEEPDALVLLRDLDCGHWQVKVYQTDAEKNVFLRRRLSSMVRTFWSALRLDPKIP